MKKLIFSALIVFGLIAGGISVHNYSTQVAVGSPTQPTGAVADGSPTQPTTSTSTTSIVDGVVNSVIS